MSYKLMLKKIRRARGLTQSEFAASIGISERKLSSWERLETRITLEDAWLCAEALDCTPNDLCGWYESHPYETKGSNAHNLSQDERVLLSHYRESGINERESAQTMLKALANQSKATNATSGVSKESEGMEVDERQAV